MQNKEILNKINEKIGPYANSLGYEVIDSALFRTSGKMVLRLLVDRSRGGISLEECSSLNEQIGVFLDAENILGTSYVLEVSSPGIDRELRTEKDFLRVCGRRVRVFLKEPLNSKIEKLGIVESVDGGSLFLDSNGVIEKISINKINKAKQVIE